MGSSMDSFSERWSYPLGVMDWYMGLFSCKGSIIDSFRVRLSPPGPWGWSGESWLKTGWLPRIASTWDSFRLL